MCVVAKFRNDTLSAVARFRKDTQCVVAKSRNDKLCLRIFATSCCVWCAKFRNNTSPEVPNLAIAYLVHLRYFAKPHFAPSKIQIKPYVSMRKIHAQLTVGTWGGWPMRTVHVPVCYAGRFLLSSGCDMGGSQRVAHAAERSTVPCPAPSTRLCPPPIPRGSE